MSAARKCDRCNKLFEPNLSSNGYANTYHRVSVTVEINDRILEKVYNHDLCPECYEGFRAWMEMEEEE